MRGKLGPDIDRPHSGQEVATSARGDVLLLEGIPATANLLNARLFLKIGARE
jgi:hypothetical protein